MIAPDTYRFFALKSASVISTVSFAGLLSLPLPLNVKEVNALLTRVGH